MSGNLKHLVLAVSLLFTVTVGKAYAGPQWMPEYQTITKVNFMEWGGAIIYFDEAVDSACTAWGTKALYVQEPFHQLTEAGQSALLSGAIVAMSAGLKARAYYDDSDSRCFVRWLSVDTAQ